MNKKNHKKVIRENGFEWDEKVYSSVLKRRDMAKYFLTLANPALMIWIWTGGSKPISYLKPVEGYFAHPRGYEGFAEYVEFDLYAYRSPEEAVESFEGGIHRLHDAVMPSAPEREAALRVFEAISYAVWLYEEGGSKKRFKKENPLIDILTDQEVWSPVVHRAREAFDVWTSRRKFAIEESLLVTYDGFSMDPADWRQPFPLD